MNKIPILDDIIEESARDAKLKRLKATSEGLLHYAREIVNKNELNKHATTTVYLRGLYETLTNHSSALGPHLRNLFSGIVPNLDELKLVASRLAKLGFLEEIESDGCNTGLAFKAANSDLTECV